jgi:hypothetical protein
MLRAVTGLLVGWLVIAGCGSGSARSVEASVATSRLGVQPGFGDPDLVVGSDGRMAAVWRDAVTGRGSCPRGRMVAEGSLDGPWTVARRFARLRICEIQLTYLASGRLLAAYTQRIGRRLSMRATTWAANGEASAASVLDRCGADVDCSLQVRADARGGAVAVWTAQTLPTRRNPDGRLTTRAAALDPDGRWQPAKRIAQNLQWPALAVGADGSAVVVGQSILADIWLARRLPGGDFTPAARIAPTTHSPGFRVIPKVAVIGADLLAVWQVDDYRPPRVLSGPLTGPWTAPSQIPAIPQYIAGNDLDFAASSSGMAAVAWRTQGRAAQVALKRPNAGFEPPRTLARIGRHAVDSTTRVAVCETGAAYLGFSSRSAAGQPTARLYRLDKSPSSDQSLAADSWLHRLACVNGQVVALMAQSAISHGRSVASVDFVRVSAAP